MRLINRFAMLLVCSAAPLVAQSNGPTPSPATSARPDTSRAVVRFVPTTDSATNRATSAQVTDLRAGAHYSRSTQPAQPMAFSPTHSEGQAVALMIVGGAAFLAGALMDNDASAIFMVGGAVIGLVGLYQYLR
jgi:hypothetical protein